MTYNILYSYLRDNGKVVNSMQLPENRDFTIRYRIIADEGKILTYNGTILPNTVLDVDDITGYSDIENPFAVLYEGEADNNGNS